jgi:acetyl esterase/lipase
MSRAMCGIVLVFAWHGAVAQTPANFDAAAAFGARPQILGMTLSPDGQRVAYIAPREGQGSALIILELKPDAHPTQVSMASGKPERFGSCTWVSNDRLVCSVWGIIKRDTRVDGLWPISRLLVINRTNGMVNMLSNEPTHGTHGPMLQGGQIIDWLPDQDGAVLVERDYRSDVSAASLIGSSLQGWGVDWVDTRTMAHKMIEKPVRDVSSFISDGHGTVRISGRMTSDVDGMMTGVMHYAYRKTEGGPWEPLSIYDSEKREGFDPIAVDHEQNIAYGYKKLDGRMALYSLTLDGSLQEKLLFASPEVDVGRLMTIGRRHRVVGVDYSTEYLHSVYFDPELEKITESLRRALPGRPSLSVVDSNVDENVLLIRAGSDSDPGHYYVFDRQAKQLHPFLPVRGELEGIQLATVKPMSYSAADGTSIPGYLTLPPGHEDAKGLPAVVLPHGGPSSRDYGGFNWLPQFLASRGYAVLQPNFRGSDGYGDAWLQKNGFKSWRTSIGDILDAGHWLVNQGIADPAKIFVMGWSYGGYAALQSAVVEPGFFKAVIAIAPVTDLDQLKEEHRHWTSFALIKEEVGDGPHVREGSPALHADKIKVPVLLFHASFDRNVGIAQSKLMDSRLAAAGAQHELVTWDNLDHQLDDSAARTQMLRKSDQFLRDAVKPSQ